MAKVHREEKQTRSSVGEALIQVPKFEFEAVWVVYLLDKLNTKIKTPALIIEFDLMAVNSSQVS